MTNINNCSLQEVEQRLAECKVLLKDCPRHFYDFLEKDYVMHCLYQETPMDAPAFIKAKRDFTNAMQAKEGKGKVWILLDWLIKNRYDPDKWVNIPRYNGTEPQPEEQPTPRPPPIVLTRRIPPEGISGARFGVLKLYPPIIVPRKHLIPPPHLHQTQPSEVVDLRTPPKKSRRMDATCHPPPNPAGEPIPQLTSFMKLSPDQPTSSNSTNLTNATLERALHICCENLKRSRLVENGQQPTHRMHMIRDYPNNQPSCSTSTYPIDRRMSVSGKYTTKRIETTMMNHESKDPRIYTHVRSPPYHCKSFSLGKMVQQMRNANIKQSPLSNKGVPKR